MTVRKRITKTGFSWEFCITIQKSPRKQYRKSGFKTKAAAKEAEERAITLYTTGRLNADTIPFKYLVEVYMENAESKYSPSTVKEYKRILNKYFSDLIFMKAKDITSKFAQSWLNRKTEETSVWIAERIRKIGVSVFSYALKKELVMQNPFAKTDSIKTPHVIHNRLETDDCIMLLNKCIEVYPEITGIIALGLFAGLRRGEILGLKWSDIDFKKKTLSIQRQFTKYGISEYLKTKTSRRVIVVCDTLLDILKWHKSRANVLNEYVFWYKGQIMSLKKIQTNFKALLKMCKFEDMRFHDTRGSYADLSMQAGIPMKLIQLNLGHSRITTTADIYTEVFNSVKNNAAIVFEKNLSNCEHIVNI